MPGSPRRPYFWIEDPLRRAREERAVRLAYPSLRYRRRQNSGGPVHVYELDVDLPGYDARHITVEFPRAWSYLPQIFADGPADESASPHRYRSRGRTRLCIWHPGDPTSRKWASSDGLLALFGLATVHLLKEAWWREHEEWIGEEAPHEELVSAEKASSGAAC